VKQRFVTPEAERAIQQLSPRNPSPAGLVFWQTPKCAFVPARVADNPSLDVEDYRERMLTHLPPVLREQLLNGDWSVSEGSVIRPEWLCSYEMQGDMLIPVGRDGKKTTPINCNDCRRFATVDTAGTSKQKAAEKRGKPASWSVCMIWDYWQKPGFLFLRHVWRAQVDWSDLKEGVRRTLIEWRPKKVLIEEAHFGPPLADELEKEAGGSALVAPRHKCSRGWGVCSQRSPPAYL
jgi:hypothetical protein